MNQDDVPGAGEEQAAASKAFDLEKQKGNLPLAPPKDKGQQTVDWDRRAVCLLATSRLEMAASIQEWEVTGYVNRRCIRRGCPMPSEDETHPP